MKSQKSKIIEIAKEVRKQCEKYANSIQAYNSPYYRKRNLFGMCAIASHVLTIALQKENIKGQVAFGFFNDSGPTNYRNHCWVETKKYIIDITATQFKYPKVYIVKKNNSNYEKRRIIENPCIFLNHWKKQAPKIKIAEKILAITKP